jgi:large subunit ribosomal protein L24
VTPDRKVELVTDMHIRKDDIVEVITGDDAGTPAARKTSRVLRVLIKEHKVVVEGVNRVYKHLKPSRQNPQGGRLSKEMPVDVSNVLLYCSTCRRGVRVGRRYNDEGRKERFCKKCSNALGLLSKPRKAYARKTT